MTFESIATSVEMLRREFTKCAWSLVRSALVICLIAAGAPCVAQDVDPPTPPELGDTRGALFAPSPYLQLNVPLRKPFGLKVFGFYIGELGVPVAQVDVPIRTTKFLTISPSYMYYSIPASGLNELSPQPGRSTDSYTEHQFRIDGTVAFPIRKLEISVRNMYVRRFRPNPLDDINRYRGRIVLTHPVAVHARTWRPFASYETFYERSGGWNRDRIWIGTTLPINKRLFVQPSYQWESSKGNRDIHYGLIGLIVNMR